MPYWQMRIDQAGDFTPTALRVLLRQMDDGSGDEWSTVTSFVRNSRLHSWEELTNAMLMTVGAPMVYGTAYEGEIGHDVLIYHGGQFCSRDDHDALNASIINQGGLLEDVPPGSDALWFAATMDRGPQQRQSTARLRARVTASIRESQHSSTRRNQQYTDMLGGSVNEYLERIQRGLNTAARIHPLCLYHLSRVLNRRVVVFAPHMAIPAA